MIYILKRNNDDYISQRSTLSGHYPYITFTKDIEEARQIDKITTARRYQTVVNKKLLKDTSAFINLVNIIRVEIKEIGKVE